MEHNPYGCGLSYCDASESSDDSLPVDLSVQPFVRPRPQFWNDGTETSSNFQFSYVDVQYFSIWIATECGNMP